MAVFTRNLPSRLVRLAPIAAITFGPTYAQDVAAIYSANKPAVVLLDAKATTSGGAVIPLHQGTGFIVTPDGHVLTARHVIEPDVAQGQSAVQIDSYQIMGNVGSKFKQPLPLEIIDQTLPQDLLLLKLPYPDPTTPYPVVQVCRIAGVHVGDPVVHVGFPLGLEVAVVNGVLSSKSGPAGLWQTNLALNYGNSGGPIFDVHGFVVGMVSGGYQGGVQGVNYFRSIQYASSLLSEALEVDKCNVDTLAAEVQKAPPLKVAQSSGISVGPVSFGASAAWLSQTVAPAKAAIERPDGNPITQQKRREATINWEASDHPSLSVTSSSQAQKFAADDGYKITKLDLTPLSQNNADSVKVQIAEDGSSATVSAILHSGPIFDQWRGWFRALVAITEVPK